MVRSWWVASNFIFSGVLLFISHGFFQVGTTALLPVGYHASLPLRNEITCEIRKRAEKSVLDVWFYSDV